MKDEDDDRCGAAMLAMAWGGVAVSRLRVLRRMAYVTLRLLHYEPGNIQHRVPWQVGFWHGTTGVHW